MVKLTKEDENKLGQILKELNEMRDVLKGGEGSGRLPSGAGSPMTEDQYRRKRQQAGTLPVYGDEYRERRKRQIADID